MKKDSNTFIKVLIILVIAALALLAIVYFMIWADKSMPQGPIAGPGMEKEMPAFMSIDNYEVYSGNYLPGDLCDGENELKELLDIVGDKVMTLNYKGIGLVAIPNHFNWDLVEARKNFYDGICSISPTMHSLIENDEYLFVIERCSAGVLFEEGQVGHEEQEACYDAYAEIASYFTAKRMASYKKDPNFDNKGRLIVPGQFSMDEFYEGKGFGEYCEGSEWKIGDELETWYVNEDIGYKLKLKYKEFYNEDLIVEPYFTNNFDGITVMPRIHGSEEKGYHYVCYGAGIPPGLVLKVEELRTVSELKEKAENEIGYRVESFEEFTIGDWSAVKYYIDGMGTYLTIVLLGEEYNFSFMTGFGEEEILMEYIETFKLIQ